MIWPGRSTRPQRIKLMRAMIPELFNEPGSLLYVGASTKRAEALTELAKAGHTIAVLEVWERFADSLEGDLRISRVIRADVCEFHKRHCQPFDYIVWLHGPEHVGFADGVRTIVELKSLTKKTIVLSCPWGRAPHGWRENPHNKHISYWLPVDFARLGYETACIGPKHKLGGQLLAWQRNA